MEGRRVSCVCMWEKVCHVYMIAVRENVKTYTTAQKEFIYIHI